MMRGSRLCPPYVAPLLFAAFGMAIGCGTNQVDGLGEAPGPVVPGSGGFSGGTMVVSGGTMVVSDGSSCPNGMPSSLGTAGFPGKAFPPGLMTPSAPVFDGIVSPIDAPPPISGGTLIVLRDGITAVAADADRDRVYVVDLSASMVRASIPLNLHDQPGRLVEDATGLVHVILRNAGALATLDPVAGKVTMRRSVCALPRGLAYDANADRLLVACAGGELLTFTRTGSTPERALALQSDLRDVVVDGSRVMVSRFRSAEVIVLDAAGTVVETISPTSFANTQVHSGSPFGPAVAWRMVSKPGGGAVMVHQRGLDGEVGNSPGGYGGLSPCDTIVHTSVTKMRAGERPLAGPAMPGFVLPVDIAVSNDGMRVAMVAAGNGHARPGSARRLFIAKVDDVAGEWEGGCGMDDVHGPSSTPICPTAPTAPTAIFPVDANGLCPMGFNNCDGLCVDPSLNLFGCGPTMGGSAGGSFGTSGSGGVGGSSSSGGNNGTGAMSVGAGAAGVAGAGGVGGVAGVAGASSVGGAGVRVQGGVGGFGGAAGDCGVDLPAEPLEPISVAFAGTDQVIVQTREPAALWFVSTAMSTVRSVSLSQESRADTGHAVFHSNSGGGLACASCHPEGHEDGRVWDFACAGMRRTQDLSGGISATAPYHWTGDLTDFPQLMQTVFEGRMSGPHEDSDHTMAALKWIDTVPTNTPLRSAADAQVVRGRALFNNSAIGCATCHAGTTLTNNATVDVGTSAQFQVPSLRGVGWRAPYMHNGCATTLAGRFTNKSCGGGDLHGKTSQLTPAQLDDLVAFLESI